jgi:hypothetical protein
VGAATAASTAERSSGCGAPDKLSWASFQRIPLEAMRKTGGRGKKKKRGVDKATRGGKLDRVDKSRQEASSIEASSTAFLERKRKRVS